MNKILIVGHPQSGYQEVETLLNDCGMSPARPSRRDGFTPIEIGTTLCKAHKAPPLQQLDGENGIAQIETSPVWHGMALDLMLGNIDQELWGWADPSSVYLLDYWKTLDQKITFILVYNSPETLLGESERIEHLNEEELQQRVHVWQAYNEALLHFYYRNRERCLLVHAEQVSRSANNYLQQVRARIGAPLSEPKQLAALQGQAAVAESEQEIVVAAGTSGGALQTTEEQQDRLTALPSDEAALERFLAEAVVSQQPQVLQLYAELQAVANLPLAEDARHGIHPLQAWRGLTAIHALNHQITVHAREQQAEAQQRLAEAEQQEQALRGEVAATTRRLQTTQTELERRQEEIQRLTTAAQATADQLAKQLLEHDKLAEASKEQKQENELVLLQLHQVQEELESLYLEAQQQKTRIEALKEAEKLANEQARSLEQLRREKDQLANQLLDREKQSKDQKQESELLLLQLHQTQEELERFHVEAQQQKKKIKALEEAEKLAAERARQLEQLRQEKNRLAAEKDSLNKLAADRNKQVEEFKKKLAEQTKLAAERATQAEDLKKKLAEANKRAQAETEERKKLAEKQTGNTEMQQENELLLLQLHQVQEELERYYIENQRLRQNAAPPAPSAPAGAAERVKNHLAYRLGAVMLQNYRSIPGLVCMPWALSREARQFRKEKRHEEEKKLPPLNQYRDAHEAQKIKGHLTYRLGATLIAHSGSPLGWIKLPFALRHEVKTFKQSKKQNKKHKAA